MVKEEISQDIQKLDYQFFSWAIDNGFNLDSILFSDEYRKKVLDKYISYNFNLF